MECCLKCPRPPGRCENAIWKTSWRTIQRNSKTFGAAVEYHPSSPGDVHWCYQVNTYWSGCVTRKKDWRLLECRFEQKFVGFLDKIHEVHSIEVKKPRQGYMWSGKRTTKIYTTTKLRKWSGSMDENLVTPLRIKKNKNWSKRNWSSTMLEKKKRIYLLIQMSKNLRIFCQKRKKKFGKTCHQKAPRRCLRSSKFCIR